MRLRSVKEQPTDDTAFASSSEQRLFRGLSVCEMFFWGQDGLLNEDGQSRLVRKFNLVLAESQKEPISEIVPQKGLAVLRSKV